MKKLSVNKLALIFMLALFGGSAFSQKSGVYKLSGEQRLFDSGKGLFEEKLYALAYERFSVLLTKYPDDEYLKYLIGICGIYISDKHNESLALLNNVKIKNPKVADLDYYMALLYHKTYQFDKCIELSNALLKKPGLNQEFKNNLKIVIGNCENAKLLVASPADVRVENLGSPPNTGDAEYAPVITSDEETILFTYRGSKSKGGLRDSYNKPDEYGFYYEDVFMSKKINGKWQPAVGVDKINTESNDAVLAISNDGQQLFIYRANAKDGGDIYMSRLEGEAFGVPEKLKGDINTPAWEGSITLSGDQKKVIFSSERPGGFGGKDLYSAERLADNNWGRVKNLGSAINTALDDDAPFLHPDGRSLVFSSKGHNSIGDYDIFLSELDEKDSTWKKPSNVGYPINTTDDDIFYVLSADGKKGYFASAKTGGNGDKDIYVQEPVIFSKNSYLTIIKGKITENLLPYAAEIAVYYAKDKRSYGIFKPNELSGNYLVSLPSGNDYIISFYHPILGEKIVNLNMGEAKEYTETLANINFGLRDTSNSDQNLSIFYPGSGKTDTTKVVYKRLSREQLKVKYGDAPVKGLKYMVQLGAYRNHKKNKNKKQKEFLQDSLSLVVANKEFDNWKEAEAFLEETKKAGQQDAFLTVLYNGKRYYLKDFVEMGVWVTSEAE